MTARKLENHELAIRLSSFRPVRTIGTMAATSLFVLAGMFMTGCGHVAVEKPIVAEAPEKAPLVVPMLRVVEGINEYDISIRAEKNDKGKYTIVMTEAAYAAIMTKYQGQNNNTPASDVHTAMRALDQLDEACHTVALVPSSDIEPETTPLYKSGVLLVRETFGRAQATAIRESRAQADAQNACTCGHEHNKDGHKPPSSPDLFKGLQLNRR
ncbi:MAG TPA: hypothetical protein DCW68_06250 [Rhodospirillaceae bacterium]|nr:MAG: hypothetical protein A2018_03970 [Alphaproteobacteria bacterium GWF2_58_20]HAU29691.1 hypothetical protein [Rhodospirillaceae bacterium]